MKKFLLVSASLLALIIPIHKPVLAEELVISGNGSGSESNINIANTQETTVQQSNTTEVNNNIDINANTGGNTASDNTDGETSITTGDINATATVENNVNASAVDVACCSEQNSTNISISGNGSESNNTIDAEHSSSTHITVSQNANIQNTVNTNANTGNNTAKDNNSTVSIETGNITLKDTIANSLVNFAFVKAANGGVGDVVINITNNGSESENSIFPKWFNDTFISINNNADIVNDLKNIANTGGNKVSGNNGDVDIKTGDITKIVDIKNKVNVSEVEVVCCEEKEKEKEEEKKEEEKPVPPAAPTPPPAQPVGGPGPSEVKGAEAAKAPEVLGAILPVTGFNWFLATIANIVMFLLGLYLRRRSGNAPGAAMLAV